MSRENLRGALFMVVSMAFFACEDMFVKLLSAELPYTQVLTVTGLLGCTVFTVMLKLKGGRLFTRDLLHPTILIRNLGEIIGSISFVMALALSDISTASAILQALPLVVVLGAALFLGEQVGWRRWLAIIIGFAGVLLIIRPGMSGFQPVSLLALLSVFGLAVRDLATRMIPRHVQSDQLGASAFLAMAIAAPPFGLLMGHGFVPMTGGHVMTFALCAGFGVAGYATLVAATRLGEISAIAPYRYARLVFALIIGVVIFRERPDLLTLVGAGIIVASGCYTMLREAQLRRRKLREAGLLA